MAQSKQDCGNFTLFLQCSELPQLWLSVIHQTHLLPRAVKNIIRKNRDLRTRHRHSPIPKATSIKSVVQSGAGGVSKLLRATVYYSIHFHLTL